MARLKALLAKMKKANLTLEDVTSSAGSAGGGPGGGGGLGLAGTALEGMDAEALQRLLDIAAMMESSGLRCVQCGGVG